MSREQVGPAIKDFREAQGLTQSEFGKIIGVSESTVGNWEDNSRWPRNKAGRLKELGLDIKAIRDRPGVNPEITGTGEMQALVIQLAITALRDGRDPLVVAELLENASGRPARSAGLPPLRNPNAG